jgi:hypothetical protein
MRLLQLHGPEGRRVAIVEDGAIRLLREARSIYALARSAVSAGIPLAKAAQADATGECAGYDDLYAGRSRWRFLPCIDHPLEPTRCLVSGTGLSHLRSAGNRQAMHGDSGGPVTDSMRMYQWGVEAGRPEPGKIGVSPEWFYKGAGSILRAHGEPLDIPPYSEDCGEEPEIAGIYLIDAAGAPRRIGMAAGNEFSDHALEKRNYLYLAASKLRTCSIGPELVISPDFQLVRGEVSIERAGAVLWSKPIQTGESVMCHNLANIEHHHFKFECHRRPGDIHVHFFGADAFSFGEGIRLSDGDIMQVRWDSFGHPLRNPVRIVGGDPVPVIVSDA